MPTSTLTRRAALENPVLTLVLILGLTCLNVWPDLVGHGSAFLESASIVQRVTNGRVFFSLGLGCSASLYALLPRRLATHDDGALLLALALSVAATAGYAACDALALAIPLAVLCAFLVGFGYGALLVRFMCQLAQAGGMRTLLLASVASLILKTTVDLLVGTAGSAVQIAVAVAMPILCAACLFAASRIPEHGGAPVDLSSLPRCNPSNERVLMAMLLMIAILHAVTRSMSALGFWGEGYVLAGAVGLRELIAFVLFALAAYYTMASDANPDMLTRFLLPILGLMACFLLLDGDISALVGLDEGARSVLSTVVELYAHTLYWIIHVTAIRYLTTHPYRLTGIAAALMSATAVFMALLFQQASGDGQPLHMDGTVAMVAIYGFTVFVALLLRGSHDGGKDAPASAAEGAAAPADAAAQGRAHLEQLAEEHGLSPRETDVFLLLAQGRDRSFIRGELFISDATVKTHTQRVYAKFGVHSKQELISAIQEL